MLSLICWLWKRDSESDSCTCIEVAQTMTDKDLRDMCDYFKALIESRAVYGGKSK